MRRHFGILVTALLALAPTAADAAKDSKAPKVTYDEHIKPIFRAKCGACHNTDKKTAGLDLTNYTALMQGGGSGTVIEKGDAAFSYLYMLVSHQSEPNMPPNSPKLDEKKLALIKEWINLGAPQNKGSDVMKKKKVDLSLSGVPTGKPEGPPPTPPRLSLEPVQHTTTSNATTAIAASPWAPLVAVGGYKQVLLYNTDTLELAGVLPFAEGTPHILRFSRNGKLLLAGGGRGAYLGVCAIWDVTTGKRITTVGEEADAVLAADISPDQKLVALGGPSKKVKVYSVATGELVYEREKHTEWIYALEFSPDNVLLASADRNGGLVLWEAATGNEYLVLDGHKDAVNALSWRTDSNLLASADDAGKVYLWEVKNGKPVRNWTAHGGGTKSVEFTRDGRILTSGMDKTVKLWGADGKQQQKFPAFKDIALDATYAAEGDKVVAGDWLGDIRVWNAKDAKQVGTLSANPPTLQMRINSANANLEKARQEIAPLNAKIESAKKALAQADDAIKQGQADLDQATATREKITQLIESVKADVAATTKQRDQTAADVKQLQATITELKQGVEKTNLAVEKANKTEDLASAAKALEDALAKRQSLVTTRQSEINKAEEKLAALAKQQQKLSTQAEKAEKTLAAAKSKVESLQADRKAKAGALAKAEQALAKKRTPLESAQVALKRWQDELAFTKAADKTEDAQASAAP